MQRVLIAAGVIAGLSAVLVLPPAAFAFPINPGQWIREYNNNTHFDFWTRCKDPRIEPERRIGYCRSMLKEGHGDDVRVLYEIGEAYVEEQKYDAAIDTLKSVLDFSTDPGTHARVRAKLEEDYVLDGQYNNAMALVDDDVKADPHSAYILNQRCWLRAIGGKDLDLALEDCNNALKQRPDDANLLDSRGLVEFKLGQLKQAEADYNAALNRRPALEDSLYMRGVIELTGGDAKSGAIDIGAAKDLEPRIAERFASYGVQPQEPSAER